MRGYYCRNCGRFPYTVTVVEGFLWNYYYCYDCYEKIKKAKISKTNKARKIRPR